MSLKVTFGSKKLETQCTDSKRRCRDFEAGIAKKIEARMAQLEVVDCVGELLPLPGKWHWLSSDRQGQFSGSLSGNWRIVTEPEERDDECQALVIVEIVDYH